MKPTLTTPIALAIILPLAVVAGCNFEADLVPLEVPEAPPAPEFGELPPAVGPPPVEPEEAGTVLESGSRMASIGNSGNSGGDHGHLEMAVAESGLAPAEGEATADFWLDTVVEQSFRHTEQRRRQGNRVDP